MIDYVVWAPPYAHNCAGIRALYRLAELLGDTAVINPPNFDGLDGAVHIFPEVMNLTPQRARLVVRWMLNKQIYETAPTELIYVWTEALDPGRPRLAVDVIEPNLFYPGIRKRSGTFIYPGKGTPSGDVDGVIITKTWPATRYELAELLRGAELVVSYDPFSMLNVEATLCGTPVVILPSQVTFGIKDWTRQDQEATDFGALGMAFGWDELDRAREEVHLAAAAYEDYRRKIADDVPMFMAATQ